MKIKMTILLTAAVLQHLIGLGELAVFLLHVFLELLHVPLQGFVVVHLFLQHLLGFLLFFLQTPDLHQQVLVQVHFSL